MPSTTSWLAGGRSGFDEADDLFGMRCVGTGSRQQKGAIVGLGLVHYVPLLAYITFWVMCLVSLGGKPLLAFYYVIPFIPYRTLRDHLGNFPLGENVLTILILCIIAGALLHGKRLPKSKLYLLWLVFGVYLYLSMWLGALLGNGPLPLTSEEVTFATWKAYMLLPLLFVAASLVIEDRKSIRMTVLLVAIAILMIDRSTLMDTMSRSWSHFDENKRDGGPLGFAGPNGLAAFLSQSAMFLWGFGQFLKRRKAKLLIYALVGLTLFATMYSFSRAAYVAVVLGALLLGVLKDRKLIPIVVVFLLCWQFVVPTAVQERVTMTQSSNGHLEASAQERVDLWTNAKKMILSDPVFGTGYATYQLVEHTAGLRDTHNWYVKVLVETGVVGLLMALAFLVLLVAVAYRVYRKGKDPLYRGLGLGFLLMVASSIILNLFGDRWTYLEINGLLWVLAGACIRASQLLDVEAEAVPLHVALRSDVAANPYMVCR